MSRRNLNTMGIEKLMALKEEYVVMKVKLLT